MARSWKALEFCQKTQVCTSVLHGRDWIDGRSFSVDLAFIDGQHDSRQAWQSSQVWAGDWSV